MTASDLPEITAVVPHSGRMLLLSRVIAHTADETVCAVDVDRSELFRDAGGSVPGWVSLEYMAQCIAAHAGLVARDRGERQRPGLFLGTRRTRIHIDNFRAGQRLRVTSRHLRGEAGLAWFECAVEDATDGEALARGRLSVYAMEMDETTPGAGHGR